jgi:hypothetical protein
VDGSNRPRGVPASGQTVAKLERPPPPRGAGRAVDAGRGSPGELMGLVADGLMAHGFDVRPPEDEGDRGLVIGCPGGRCSVSVGDWGDVEWQWCPAGLADPGRIADVAAALLTGRTPGQARPANGHALDCVTVKGLVGLELRARGFDVGLAVYEDEEHFDVRAEIVVTSPGSGDGARVHVTDEGSVTWTRDQWAEATTVVRSPGRCQWITDPAKLAGAVVTTIARALSQAALAAG